MTGFPYIIFDPELGYLSLAQVGDLLGTESWAVHLFGCIEESYNSHDIDGLKVFLETAFPDVVVTNNESENVGTRYEGYMSRSRGRER